MNHLLAACDLMEAAGRTHVPVCIKELRAMVKHYIPADQWKRKTAKISVSKKIGAKKKADRLAKKWREKSK